MSWFSLGAFPGEASILVAIAEIEASSTGPQSPQANVVSAARSALRLLDMVDVQTSGLDVPTLWTSDDLSIWRTSIRAAGESFRRAEGKIATISGSAQLLATTHPGTFAKSMGVYMSLTRQLVVLRTRLEEMAKRMPGAPDLPPTSISPVEPRPYYSSRPPPDSTPLLLVAGLVMGAAGLVMLFGGRR